jgi:antitoxin component YwqK of YwqJK toxin-antitoxin module
MAFKQVGIVSPQPNEAECRPTLADGEQDGLWTSWHEDGQKKSEVAWKDGKLISAKYWNSKGEEVDSRKEAIK